MTSRGNAACFGAALLCPLLLGGCTEGKLEALGRCEMEAQRLYPGKPIATTDIFRFVKSCMRAVRYELAQSKTCSDALVPPETCYLSWWDRLSKGALFGWNG